ncbi:MAG TPA: helix-turn-helix transcriptional regulator [Methylomirabilota bacterium]|jgi:DNA-binding NarL/FixJ family response regulator|nr:helix-turn-helix transcriptional regulator [Methylomirabilota bacterium]
MRVLAGLRDPVAVAIAAATALAAIWLGHDLLAITAATLAVLAARLGAGLALRRPTPPPPSVSEVVLREANWFAPLTRREADVAVLIRDSTNKEIAERLVLSERTIDNHVQNIMNKLNLHHRAQIASWVTERNRPSLPPKP